MLKIYSVHIEEIIFIFLQTKSKKKKRQEERAKVFDFQILCGQITFKTYHFNLKK